MRTKNLIVFSLLLVLSSCGEEMPKGPGGPNKEVEMLIGSVKTLDAAEKLSQEEADLILSACENLERKTQLLGDFVDLRKTLKYQKTSKGCEDKEESKPESYDSKITLESGQYKYDENSPFAYVITDRSFTMGDVCSHIKSASEAEEEPELPSRRLSSGESTDPVWVSAYGQGSFQCSNDEDVVCIYIQTGAATANQDRYRVRNVKSYTIIGESDDPERGFVSTRLEASLCVGESDVYSFQKTQLVSAGI